MDLNQWKIFIDFDQTFTKFLGPNVFKSPPENDH